MFLNTEMNRILKTFTLCVIFLVASVVANAWEPLKPSEITPTRLFHITRSLNANIVCYDANVKGGKLDVNKPINVYWLNRCARPGEKSELNMVQRKMAFGYNIVRKGADWAEVRLTAESKRSGRVCRHNGKWVFITTINGQKCIMTEIYAKAKNKFAVEYIELIGTSIKDGLAQKERVNH